MSRHSKPWLLLISTYTTQYIGIAFMMSATFAILRQHGIALDKLALLNMIALPMLGKILYAPFVDSVRLFTQGQYRSWLLFAQLCMTGLLLACGYLEIQKQFPIMLVLFIVYSFFMSIQDVAIDGLATKILNPLNDNLQIVFNMPVTYWAILLVVAYCLFYIHGYNGKVLLLYWHF